MFDMQCSNCDWKANSVAALRMHTLSFHKDHDDSQKSPKIRESSHIDRKENEPKFQPPPPSKKIKISPIIMSLESRTICPVCKQRFKSYKGMKIHMTKSGCDKKPVGGKRPENLIPKNIIPPLNQIGTPPEEECKKTANEIKSEEKDSVVTSEKEKSKEKQVMPYRYPCLVSKTCEETFKTDKEIEDHVHQKHSDAKLSKVDVNELLLVPYQNREADRLKTFKNCWPNPAISMEKLANAGFIYTRRGDSVQCAYCAGVIGDWEDDDDPMTEHKNTFPKCPKFSEKESEDKKAQNLKFANEASLSSFSPRHIRHDIFVNKSNIPAEHSQQINETPNVSDHHDEIKIVKEINPTPKVKSKPLLTTNKIFLGIQQDKKKPLLLLEKANYEFDDNEVIADLITNVNSMCQKTDKRITGVEREFKFFSSEKSKIDQLIEKCKELWEKFQNEFKNDIQDIQQRKANFNVQKLIGTFNSLKTHNENLVKDMLRQVRLLEKSERLGLALNDERNNSFITSSSSRMAQAMVDNNDIAQEILGRRDDMMSYIGK